MLPAGNGLLFVIFWTSFSSHPAARYICAAVPALAAAHFALVGTGVTADEALVKSATVSCNRLFACLHISHARAPSAQIQKLYPIVLHPAAERRAEEHQPCPWIQVKCPGQLAKVWPCHKALKTIKEVCCRDQDRDRSFSEGLSCTGRSFQPLQPSTGETLL